MCVNSPRIRVANQVIASHLLCWIVVFLEVDPLARDEAFCLRRGSSRSQLVGIAHTSADRVSNRFKFAKQVVRISAVVQTELGCLLG